MKAPAGARGNTRLRGRPRAHTRSAASESRAIERASGHALAGCPQRGARTRDPQARHKRRADISTHSRAHRRWRRVFCGYWGGAVEVSAELYSILGACAARSGRATLMKTTALLFAAAMIAPADAGPKPDAGTGKFAWSATIQDGRPHYARVYCRGDGHCYRPRRHAAARTRRHARLQLRAARDRRGEAATTAATSGVRSAIST